MRQIYFKVQLSTTYVTLMAVVVAAVIVAAATDADHEADSDPDTNPTNPPVTDNPRCKHPLFCRQRPPMFGQRLRPLIPTTTPSTTTTTKRSTSRFSSRPNLIRADSLPKLNNTLQQSTRSRFPSRTTEAPKEDTKGLHTADIEDLAETEEQTISMKRNRLKVTAIAPSTPSSSRAGTFDQVTTSTLFASTSRRRLPLTMARYRTNTSKNIPRTTLAPAFDQEDVELTTVPATVSPIADCPDGVCTTIKRVPGATVVVRKKKIRPVAASQSQFHGTTETTRVSEVTSYDVPQENTTIRQTLPSVESPTRRPFVSHRAPSLYKGRVSQKIRAQTNTSTPKESTKVIHEVNMNSVSEAVTPRQPNVNKPKHRKKLTTTAEPPDNTEYPTTQPWREDVSYEEAPAKSRLRSNKKCGKSCRGSFRRPTTTPEPENYPTTIFPLRPLKQQNVKTLDSVDQKFGLSLSTNSPKVVYKPETEKPSIIQRNSFSNILPLVIDEQSITVQYPKELVPTAGDQNAPLFQHTYTDAKEFVELKKSLPVQTKVRTGKNGGEEENIKSSNNFNQLQSSNMHLYSQSPLTTPGVSPGNQPGTPKTNDVSGYSYSKPAVTFNPTTKKPSQKNTKNPAYEAPKSMGGYVYSKPTTILARPTPALPKPQMSPILGLNSYMYPRPQMTLLYSTTINPIMQESTSFLPMLLQKKKEVLENTPIIGPAMTTVRNILNFITKPEEVFVKNSQQFKYQAPYQYPTTYTPMIPQTTYPPYMNFPPYPPRNTYQKQTAIVDSGFKLKAKPRKKSVYENRSKQTPSGFDALTMRPMSSPRPFKKQTDEPYRFESTSSQYDTSLSSTLKAEASLRHHHYRSPTRGKHVGHGNSSGRETRTRRPSRKRCQNTRCRSSRQNTFRSEDASIYVPVSSIMKVKGQKIRTKRQALDAEGYVYPRPTSSTTTGSSLTTGNVVLTTKTTASFSSTSLTTGSTTSTTPGSSTSVTSGSSDNTNEQLEGYEYPRPPGSLSMSTSSGLTSTTSIGPTSTATKTAILASSGGSNGSQETFEGYDYSKPPGGATLTLNPSSMASGGLNTSTESFQGYDYLKPAKPFLAEPGSTALPATEAKGYDYPKPSKQLST